MCTSVHVNMLTQFFSKTLFLTWPKFEFKNDRKQIEVHASTWTNTYVHTYVHAYMYFYMICKRNGVRNQLSIFPILLAVDFFNQINMLYGTITDFCTPESCPVMSAGAK